MAGKKSKGDSKQSSGQRKTRLRKRLIRRLEQKISRWKRYQAEEKSSMGPAQKENKHFRPRNRHMGWDIAGLERQKAFLEGLDK